MSVVKTVKSRRALLTALEQVRAHFFSFFFIHIYIPASGQAVVTGVVPSPPPFLPSIFIAHRVQQSHCSSIFHRVLLTHALGLSASQFVHKKKSPRIYTSLCTRGIRTHETDPYQARGQPDTPPGRSTIVYTRLAFLPTQRFRPAISLAPTPTSFLCNLRRSPPSFDVVALRVH